MPKDIIPADAHDSPLGLCVAHIDTFATSLSGFGYAALTVQLKRQIAASFARWTRQRQIAVADLDESHVATFLDQARRRSKSRDAVKWSALRLLLKHLRAEGEVPTPPPPCDQSPLAVLQERYEHYLRRGRGLAAQSIRSYRPFIHKFLLERVAMACSTYAAALKPQDVRDFLLEHIRKRLTKSSKLLATALRSFLRFLFLRGETAVDLSLAVPTVRQWRQASVHTFLRPEEVEQALRACDQTTLVGRRDHAVLLLARLGLRAGEVVALELGDIRWKTGEIFVRGKAQVLEQLPLLADIGEALAVYLHDDRGQSASRRVFLRMRAPRVGFTSQTAVGAIARRAIARAGLRPSLRGAHLFRYSLATTMIRRGASLAEISEILRHRSPDTTEIYAKVDFEALRGVARQWPGTGGRR